MTFWLSLAGAVLGAASILLHFIAPRTKTTLDDRAVELIDKAKDKLGN